MVLVPGRAICLHRPAPRYVRKLRHRPIAHGHGARVHVLVYTTHDMRKSSRSEGRVVLYTIIIDCTNKRSFSFMQQHAGYTYHVYSYMKAILNVSLQFLDYKKKADNAYARDMR